MRKLCPFTWFCLIFAAFFFSCAVAPQVKETSPIAGPTGVPIAGETGVTVGGPIETPRGTDLGAGGASQVEKPVTEKPLPETGFQGQEISSAEPVPLESKPQALFASAAPGIPVRPIKPITPEFIMGRGLILPDDLSDFLLGINPEVEKAFAQELALLYIEEASIEGVNHDAAFAQMCLETGFLRFGGLVTADQNNFCGLGATGPGYPGAKFPDPRTGVRAHIQHLKAYATDAPLKQELVDPRYHFVRYGSSPAIKGLAGTWAVDGLYADKINNILERLYNFVYGT